MSEIIENGVTTGEAVETETFVPESELKEGEDQIHIRNLSKTYITDDSQTVVLEDFSLDIRKGELITIVGPSGCGKTTILRMLAGLVQPTSGQILIGNRECSGPGADRGMVFQDFALFPWRTVRKNVEFGLEIAGIPKEERRQRADKYLKIQYDITTLEEKILGKYLLQKDLGLPMCDDPIYGMVARLTDQKGVGILIPILEQFLRHRVQIIVEGTGDPNFEKQMHEIAARHPDKMIFRSVYDNALAHQIEAASDFFLMPSIFEPCGLNQMYSLAYGTLPIVRGVGGLRDTVTNYDDNHEMGNGFIFWDPNPEELLSCLRRTLIFYLEDPVEMQRIRQNAMRVRFNWDESCKKYEDLYKEALAKPKWW